jgi:uncharacterized protein
MQSEQFFETLRAGDAERVSSFLRERPELAAARDGAGLSAVTWALYNRKSDLVALLVAAGPPLDLFEAAALGLTDDVAAHVARDPDGVRAYSKDGFTALHLASFFARSEVARLLVDRGADVRALARNPSRVEPLHSAAAAGQSDIALLLLGAGADPNARQISGFTLSTRPPCKGTPGSCKRSSRAGPTRRSRRTTAGARSTWPASALMCARRWLVKSDRDIPSSRNTRKQRSAPPLERGT